MRSVRIDFGSSKFNENTSCQRLKIHSWLTFHVTTDVNTQHLPRYNTLLSRLVKINATYYIIVKGIGKPVSSIIVQLVLWLWLFEVT